MALKEEGRVAHSVWISTALFLLSAKRGCSRPAGGTSLSGRGKQASQASQASTAVFRNPTIGALPQRGGGADCPALEGTVQRGRRCWRGANSTVTVQAGGPVFRCEGNSMAALRGILPSTRFCSVKSNPHHPLPSQADPTRFPQLPLDRGAFAPRPRNPTTPLPMFPRPEHLPTSIHQQPFRGHLLDTSSHAPGQPAPRATPPSRRRPHSAIAPRRPAIGFHWKLEGNHPSQPACRTAPTTELLPPPHVCRGCTTQTATQQATRRHGGSAGSRPRRIEIQYSPNMHWTSSASRDRGTTGCVSCHCLATGTGGRYLPGRLSCRRAAACHARIWVSA